MSERKKGSRAAESETLEARWFENAKYRGYRAPPSQWKSMVESNRASFDGASDVVAKLALIALATGSEVAYEAMIDLTARGLGDRDWKTKLKAKVDADVQPYDVIRKAFAEEQMLAGASQLQAAQRTAARFGCGSTFVGETEAIERLLRQAPHQPVEPENLPATSTNTQQECGILQERYSRFLEGYALGRASEIKARNKRA